MNYLLFTIGCMMVFWPMLILIGLYQNINDDEKKLLIKLSGVMWLGIVAGACTVICLGVVICWRAF